MVHLLSNINILYDGQPTLTGQPWNAIAKFENLKDLIVELRGQSVLLDSDVAQIYGVETRDINKAMTNNPDKFPAGYVVELSKTAKTELVEHFTRFNKLKHSTV